MSEKRSILNYFQLVTQSNEFDYVRKNKIEDPLWGRLFKKTENGKPEKFYIFEEGLPMKNFGLLGKSKKLIQQVAIFHVNKSGLYITDIGLEKMPEKLYRGFIRTKPKKLSQFVKKFCFCAFPLSKMEDFEYVKDEYKKLPEKTPQERNLKYLLQKHQTLKMLVERFDEEEVIFDGVSWLNKQVEYNISPILINTNSFPCIEIEDAEEKVENPFTEFFGLDKTSNGGLVWGYRIFGHFALCCLEFLSDIEKKQLMKRCKNPSCNEFLEIKPHGNQKYCREDENPRCYLERRRVDRRKQRYDLKKRKRK